jgi:hypothetical protein
MERRKAIAGDNVARIRLEVSRKIRNRELEWQGRCIFFFSPQTPIIDTTLIPSHSLSLNANRPMRQVASGRETQGASEAERGRGR